jgi:hypothetical protein
MSTAMGLMERLGLEGYHQYFDELLQNQGNPTDALDIMRLQQLVMLHLRSIKEHARAGKAADQRRVNFSEVEVYNSVAVALSNAYRKMDEALAKNRRSKGQAAHPRR